MKRVLGSCKTSRFPHPPAKILKVYIEVLTGLSHVNHPDGPSNTLLSQGCVLGLCPSSAEKTSVTHVPSKGEGVRRRLLSGSSLRVNCWSRPLNYHL